MNDYISRDDVLKAIDYQHEVNNVFESEAAYVQMWETINDDIGIKSADVQPICHGRWINEYLEEDDVWWADCTNCKNDTHSRFGRVSSYAFCPNCGARMDGDTNG